jgi:hypothetical protein
MGNSGAMCLETWPHASPLFRIIFQWKTIFHQSSMRTFLAAMIMFCEHPAYAGCEGAHSTGRISFRRHGMTRAALDEKNLWVRLTGF